MRELTNTRVIAASIITSASVATAALADDRFGALSYSRPNGVYAIELDLPTREAAERAALTACMRLGRDCSTPVWVMNGCVAIAIGRAHGYGTGWGSSRESAEDEATSVCRDHAPSCAIKRTACTSR